MNIAIIGLGLIGGSVGAALQNQPTPYHRIGVDTNQQNAARALQLGLVDNTTTLAQAVASAQLVILAVPVQYALQVLPQVLNHLPTGAAVIDMGSTKAAIIQTAEKHQKRSRFVATHPMAGTENSGPDAAFAQLFNNKIAIICNAHQSDADALNIAENLYKALGSQTIYMDAHEHDVHAAYVSHISHISSFLLASTVLEKEKSDAAIFNLAAGGFTSTVRLAKSSPDMWTPIFQQNKDNILEVLDTYLEQLLLWRRLIANNRFNELHNIMAEANSIKKVLDKKQNL